MSRDLVGKVKKDIPEDDPRTNTAMRAAWVGDNVGDCAGMAADIFESYEVTIVSALILGLALVTVDPSHSLKWIVYPLIIRGIGVMGSVLGTFTVPIWEKFPIKFLEFTTQKGLCSALTKFRASIQFSGRLWLLPYMPKIGD